MKVAVALALVLVASLGCSGCRKKAADVEDAPFETPSQQPLDPSLPRYARKPPRIDVPGTGKKGDLLADGGAYPDSEILRPNNIVVTFDGARSVGRGAVAIAFTITNKGNDALPIDGAKHTAATIDDDAKSVAGTLDRDPKQLASCLGTAPPHGTFACNVVYRFGDRTPRELEVTFAGITFRVLAEQDAGKP
jgi:hypothetical protein